MKREMKLVTVATAAALLVGCASGGDTFGNDVIGDNPLEMLLCAPLFICGAKKTTTSSGASTSTSVPTSPSYVAALSASSTIASWEDLPPDTHGNAYGAVASIGYKDAGLRINSVSDGAQWWGGVVGFEYDADRKLAYFSIPAGADTFADLSRAGYSGIDFGFSSEVSSDRQSPFTSVAGDAYVVGLVANPFRLGWNYQSFGAWNDQVLGAGGTISSQSFGGATPVSAVPLSGRAMFTGKVGGLYVSPTGEGSIAAGDVTVNADFSARSLSFVSSNTITTRDVATATPAPNLNLSGTLSYAPGSGRFSGTLTSAGGTISGTSNGQFYGPKAEELGGVFVVRSATTVETFTGAYGAKR